ncbi:hypothetical protein EXIGLDRAFT_650775 [Exidia glandulosa HHB12029]|uniref:BTB domain-containing protein n=1 Tax=Exidia glandulosa HHB12029 TaxID=1314781 RepID=A0A166A659_EXIGL|nr:hypothetical protein EXIGLDRAFT_689356 [Exidia glandulosa HHB12029]KZV88839.1 hypothetical protein EXIGLDRAFT_650775 [Exidia glandulosa HHB12029]
MASTSSLATTCTRHPALYIDDGNIVLLAETTLFKVHRSFLTRGSAVFHDMFAMPAPPGSTQDGDSDEQPVILHQVRAQDFERLLRILYPPEIGRTALRTADEWASVYELARRFQFESLTEVALETLAKMPLPPVERIRISRTYEILPDWIHVGAIQLVIRFEPLSIDEVNTLGTDIAVCLFHARERYRAKEYAPCVHTCSVCDCDDVRMFCESCQEYTELPSSSTSANGQLGHAIEALEGAGFPPLSAT